MMIMTSVPSSRDPAIFTCQPRELSPVISLGGANTFSEGYPGTIVHDLHFPMSTAMFGNPYSHALSSARKPNGGNTEVL